MLSSDATSENGKKKSLLPNVSFLDEFSQGGDQKNMSSYLYKGTFGIKKWPQVAIFRGKNCLSSPYLYRKKKVPCYSYQGFYGEKMAPSRHIWGRERPNF
jgi:hypothetical protein